MMGRSLRKPQGRKWWEMLFEWPWNLSMINYFQNGAWGWSWWNHEEEEDDRCFLKDLGIFFFFEPTRNFASWTTDFLVEQLVNCYWFVWLVVSFCVICLLVFYGIGWLFFWFLLFDKFVGWSATTLRAPNGNLSLQSNSVFVGW